MKNLVKRLLLGLVIVAVSSQLTYALDKPYDGISADELMRITYDIQYTLFAKDYQSVGDVWMITKGGFKRHRKFLRSRIVLLRESDDMRYKDVVVFTEPQNVKGLAILSWTHMNPEKASEQWLWLPSQGKVRRVSQGDADDSFMGSDFTTEEITTRRWEDETYELVGEKKFEGYQSDYNGKTYYQDTDCYVVEAKPKKEDWYYSKRVVWLDKATGASIFDEIYDTLGRKVRTILKEYGTPPDFPEGYLPQTFLECANLRTGHKTVITFDDIKFDSGLKERLFSEKALMRTKW
ncbi:MAG: outer membrane lipoprotein-sorting protein [Deltaproteobacteria bacterium]|nr:MAG: outer membrane lipoprotein-sorting protein [Deltaproteobacteria bacterium]